MQTSGGKAFKADRIAWAKALREEYAWQIQEIAKRLECTWRKNEVGKVGSEVRREKGHCRQGRQVNTPEVGACMAYSQNNKAAGGFAQSEGRVGDKVRAGG